MIKKTIVAVALSALACAALDVERIGKNTMPSTRCTRRRRRHPRLKTIPGVNPMTNAGVIPPVSQPQTYAPIQGVNPMTNVPPAR